MMLNSSNKARETKKLRILTISHYTKLYGANRSLLNLIEGSKGEIEWVVIGRGLKCERDNPLKDELNKLQVKYYHLHFRTDIQLEDNNGFKSRFFKPLKETLINIVYAFYIAWICRVLKISLIHSNSSVFCLGAYISKISGLPHVWHFREFISSDYGFKYNYGFGYLTYWANKSCRVISISEAIYKECVEERKITARSSIIYNGVIWKKDIPCISNKTTKPKYKLLILGVIIESKNQLEAIKAVELLSKQRKDIELFIVGDKGGEYSRELEKYVVAKEIGSFVTFTGYESDTKQLYKDAYITIVCSRKEGMGRVTLESMAMGTPVIGFDSGGTSELIDNRVDGILYRGNENNLANSISELLTDQVLYKNMQKAGQLKVLEKYSIEKYAVEFSREINNI